MSAKVYDPRFCYRLNGSSSTDEQARIHVKVGHVMLGSTVCFALTVLVGASPPSGALVHGTTTPASLTPRSLPARQGGGEGRNRQSQSAPIVHLQVKTDRFGINWRLESADRSIGVNRQS